MLALKKCFLDQRVRSELTISTILEASSIIANFSYCAIQRELPVSHKQRKNNISKIALQSQFSHAFNMTLTKIDITSQLTRREADLPKRT